MERFKKTLNGRKKNILKYYIKNKRKDSQRELKRDACEIYCREIVF